MKKTAAIMLMLSCLMMGNYAVADDVNQSGYYSETENNEEKEKTELMYKNRAASVRRMEYLDRGLIAVPSGDGMLVSWRCTGTDTRFLQYDLYRDGKKLNDKPINATNFFDTERGKEYTLVEISKGTEKGISTTVTAWDNEYTEFKVRELDNYIIDDGAVGDLDGDGQYEIVLRRIPEDMNVETRTEYPIIEAYELTGEYMWTINIGPNEINEHDLNMMIYDFNGDGAAEIIMRSFEGTVDGEGNVVTDANGAVTDYSKDSNNLAIFKDRQYIISTPEYLSMYCGKTGAEMARTDLLPSQSPLTEWSYNYNDKGRLTKRASHHNFGIAYLDGVTPSFVEVRGAWDNVRIAAWHIEENKFVLDWEAKTPNKEDVNSIYGAVNHNITVVDVDFDGKDEIFSGPMGVDDDGQTMYAVKATDSEGTQIKLAHGDAFDIAKMTPKYNGYYAWACHETKNLPANIELHDARTGQVIFGYEKNKDTGRSRAADIDPNYEGFELWGSTSTIPMNINGKTIASSWNKFKVRLADGTYETDSDGNEIKTSLPMNFKIYWDGDLLSEFLDGTRISEWDYNAGEISVIYDAIGCAANCGTKAVPCIAADLFGDWRDEVVWKTADEKGIRIYSTNIPTKYKIPTMMHDWYYRASIAMQNNHYNQPANVSYYLGAETTEIPAPRMYTVYNGERIENPDNVETYSVIPKDEITINRIEDGKIKFEVNIDVGNNKLIVGLYRNDVLERAYINVTSGSFADNGGEYKMKAFVWKDMTPLRPVIEAKLE